MTTTFLFAPIADDTVYVGLVDMDLAAGSTTISYQLGFSASLLRQISPKHDLVLGLGVSLAQPGISGGYSLFAGTDSECTGRFIGSFSKLSIQLGYAWRLGKRPA